MGVCLSANQAGGNTYYNLGEHVLLVGASIQHLLMYMWIETIVCDRKQDMEGIETGGITEKNWETKREGVNKRWSLTHLVGQEHKRQCLPGLQWSMKPPGECNRRSLEPPYWLLTTQHTNTLKGKWAEKGHKLVRSVSLPGARMPTKDIKWVLTIDSAVWFSFDLRQ